MVILLGLFAFSLVGMILVPLRHVPALRRDFAYESEPIASSAQSSVVRTKILHAIESIETWYRHTATDQMLKVLDSSLKIFERMAGRIAGQIKEKRMLVQERFRVIPRESMYWKQVHTWKKTTGGGMMVRQAVAVRERSVDEEDISNHLYI